MSECGNGHCFYNILDDDVDFQSNGDDDNDSRDVDVSEGIV